MLMDSGVHWVPPQCQTPDQALSYSREPALLSLSYGSEDSVLEFTLKLALVSEALLLLLIRTSKTLLPLASCHFSCLICFSPLFPSLLSPAQTHGLLCCSLNIRHITAPRPLHWLFLFPMPFLRCCEPASAMFLPFGHPCKVALLTRLSLDTWCKTSLLSPLPTPQKLQSPPPAYFSPQHLNQQLTHYLFCSFSLSSVFSH